jgi:hypothetical protein
MNVKIISANVMAVLTKEKENYIEVCLRVWETRKSLVGIVAKVGLDDTGFFSFAKRPYLLWGSPQPSVKCVSAVKRPGHKADHSPPSSAEFRMSRATPVLCPECLNGLYICYCAFGNAGVIEQRHYLLL